MKENSKVFFIDSVGHADGIRAVCDRHVSAQSALDGRIFRCNILTSPAWSDHQYDWLGYGAGALRSVKRPLRQAASAGGGHVALSGIGGYVFIFR